MAIVCRKCKNILNEAEVLGHIVNDIYDVIKDAAPTVVPAVATACILAYVNKRGYVEDIAFSTANRQAIICSVCMKYKGWIKIEDIKIDKKEIE